MSFDDIDTNDVVDISYAANGDIAWSNGTIDPALAAQLVAGFATSATDAAAPGDTPWTYTVNDANLDFLSSGETITFSYTVTATDSTGATATDTVSFTINGTNDAPTVDATAASAITEAGDASAQDLSQSGTVSFDDIDTNDVVDISYAANGDIAWSNGTIDPALAAQLVAGFATSATDAAAPGDTPWTYTVNDANLDFLSSGETITFSYTVTATDSTGATATDTVSFTINGTNDAPTVDATAASAITEAGDASAQDLSQSGTVSFDDIDTNDVVDISYAANGDIAWSNGTIDPALAAQLVAGFATSATDAAAPGDTPWTYTVNDANLDFLSSGETITFSYTVTATDSTGATATDTVSFTINGTNDAPTVDATAASAITEAGDASAQDLSQSGTVSFDDIDTNDVVDISYAANGDIAWSNGTIDPALAAQLVAGFATSATDAAAPGDTPWTYTVNDANLDFLSSGETITFSYTVTATDSTGATATDTVSFTINGTNDAPTAVGDAPVSVTEDFVGTIGGNTLTNDTDVDNGDTRTVTAVDIGSGFQTIVPSGITTLSNTKGTYTFQADGAWTFDPSLNQNNASGISAAFTYQITDSHGATATAVQPITVTDGTAAANAAAITLDVNEAALSTAGATGSNPSLITEVDNSPSLSFTAGSDNLTSFAFSTNLSGLVTDLNGGGQDIWWQYSSATQIKGFLNAGMTQLAVTLDLNAPASIAAGASGTATVTATLSDNLSHPNGLAAQISSLGNVNVQATDTDGDIATGAATVRVQDDVPNNITAMPMIVSNETTTVGTAPLNFFENIGADGGTVVFDGTNNSTLLSGGNAVKSGGVDVKLFGFNTGVLTAKTGAAADGTGGTTIFTITLNPNSATEANDNYTVQFFQRLDDGSQASTVSVGSLSAGNGTFRLVEGAGNRDLLFSAQNGAGAEGTVNTNSSQVGVNNPSISGGERLRIDFVNNGVAPGTTFDYDSHYDVNGFSFGLPDVSAGATVKLRVYSDSDAEPGAATSSRADLINDAQVQVTRILKNGVELNLSSLTSTVEAGVTVYTVSVALNDTITVFSDDGYNRIEVENPTGNNIGLNTFGYQTENVGSPIPMSFGLKATDGDGDIAAGSLSLTTQPAPDLTGTAAAEALVGGALANVIIGGGGADLLIGNGGSDTITYETGATIHGDSASAPAGTNSDTLVLTQAVNINLSLVNQDTSAASVVTGFENVNASAVSSAVVLTGSGGANSLIGGTGGDTLTAGGGGDTLTGNAGADTFNVESGTDSITDLGTGGADILVVSAGATAIATATAAWTASVATNNAGTASVNANGFNVSVASASGPNGWTLNNSSTTAVTLTGSANGDIVTSSSAGDTINAGAGADTVKIDAGSATNRSWTVNLGSDAVQDTIIFNHTALGLADQTVVTVSNFDVADSDRVAVILNGTSITATGVQTITADNTTFSGTARIVEIAINNAGRVTTSLANDGDGSNIESIIQAATTNFPATGNYTFIVYSDLTGTANAGIYTVNISDATNPSNGGMTVEHIMTLNGVGFGAMGAANFANLTLAPAGVAGEPVNLALTDPSADHVGAVTVTIAGVPAGWSLSEGAANGDGSWTVHTADVAALTITSPGDYTGALVLTVTQSWTNPDGSTGNAIVADNVEVYAPGNPIFAISGDDNLTGSSGQDLFVFAQPIGHDVIYSFDAMSDQIDLIGYANFTGFGDIQAHTANDAAGNAVITLADGQSITLNGVDAASLAADDFVFDQTPFTVNASHMVISNGAILPLSGVIDNTGTIELNSAGVETDLQLIQHGITLQGHGQVMLSDSTGNVITGTVSDVTLTNVDNTISGAGQLGAGQMILINEGTIIATGTNSLEIDTGAHTIVNSGTLEATGSGGLVIDSNLDNSGLLWANGADITLNGSVTGGGTALIDGVATIEFEAASAVDVTFAAEATGTLKLGDSFDFSGMVSGFNEDDHFDLVDVTFGESTSVSYVENTEETGGTLTVTDGVHTANISLLGDYSADGFAFSADDTTGTLLSYRADLI
ncbi:VCBS repeat-containing protein [Bradyrhizobium sp. OAE829]